MLLLMFNAAFVCKIVTSVCDILAFINFGKRHDTAPVQHIVTVRRNRRNSKFTTFRKSPHPPRKTKTHNCYPILFPCYPTPIPLPFFRSATFKKKKKMYVTHLMNTLLPPFSSLTLYFVHICSYCIIWVPSAPVNFLFCTVPIS